MKLTLYRVPLLLLFFVITMPSDSYGTLKNDDGFDNRNSSSEDFHMTLKHAIVEVVSKVHYWKHYKPLLAMKSMKLLNSTVKEDCYDEPPKAVEEFPTDFLTSEQRLRGLFLFHIMFAVYFFTFMAIICDTYFIPSVERICQILDISQDVAASTFMATATTMPEFFANTISTFVADSDMGLSAIVGSTLFNTLGVAACASLFVAKPVQIDWWPLTRDALLFSFHITVLVSMAWDGVVMWWEATILVVLYFNYWIVMFQNTKVEKFVKYYVEDRLLWCQRIKNYDITNQRPMETASSSQGVSVIPVKLSEAGSIIENYKPVDYESIERVRKFDKVKSKTDLVSVLEETEDEDNVSLWEMPKEKTIFQKCWYVYTWPIRFLLHYTIPNPIKYPNWFVLSFGMCIAWIGCVSYMVFWMVVLVGDTFGIPDPIMGLTFLAFGGCMPEAISAVIVARRGSGQMGVSNALGANSLAVLFSLGVPWFIRTMINGAWTTGARVRIFSHGIEYTILGLLLAVATLYLTLSLSGYKLRKVVGVVLILAYCVFATFGILIELDVFFNGYDRC